MIEINANRDTYALHAVGHAGFAIKGQDPVCAAVSTLVITYASVAENLDKAGYTGRKSNIEIADGQAFIRIYPKRRAYAFVQAKMDTILEGLRLVASEFPENVKVTITG